MEDGKREKIILEYTEKYPILMANWNAFYPISSKEVGIACPATNRFLIYDIEKGNVKTELSYDIKQNSIRSFPGIDNPIHVKGSLWACPILLAQPIISLAYGQNTTGNLKVYIPYVTKKRRR